MIEFPQETKGDSMDLKEQKLKVGEEGIPTELKNYEVILHKMGNCNDVEENNNKFFSLEAWKCPKAFYVYTNYGRVENVEYCGVAGLYGPFSTQSDMEEFFNKKWKEKSKKYREVTFVKASKGSPKARLKTYGVSEDEIPDDKKKKLIESKVHYGVKIDIHPTIERLVRQWYSETNTAIQNNSAVTITSNGLETSLGILTFGQLVKGKTILGEISEAIKNNDNKEIAKLTSNFYSYIPTVLGRKITTHDYIKTDALIQQKLDLIKLMEDSLDVGGTSYVSTDIIEKYKNLGIEAEVMDKSDAEFIRIVKKVKETKGNTHYSTTDKVLNIVKLTVKADKSNYLSCNISNELELFHGSRNVNCLGILRKGLLIAPPEAPRSGLALGLGLYCAKNSSKSINYSLYPFPGIEKSKNCFLFITNNKCGKQMKVYYGNGREADNCKKQGYDSVHAEAGKGLIYDEFVFPTTEQVTITHIIELER